MKEINYRISLLSKLTPDEINIFFKKEKHKRPINQDSSMQKIKREIISLKKQKIKFKQIDIARKYNKHVS